MAHQDFYDLKLLTQEIGFEDTLLKNWGNNDEVVQLSNLCTVEFTKDIPAELFHETSYKLFCYEYILGVALRDSPVGLAAYILEKFVTLTNPSWRDLEDGGLNKVYTMTRLLDNIMIYWVTRSMTTSIRLYSETFNKAHMGMSLDRIPITEVPTGCARFRNDLWYFPEALLRDKYANMVYLSDHETGHFPALEVPDLLSRDFFDFVHSVEELKKG